MSPEQVVVVNSFVMVLPMGNPLSPPEACWGIVKEITEEGLLKIRVGREQHNEICARLEQVIPFAKTDGLIEDPQRAFVENAEKIMLELLLNFLGQQGAIRTSKRGPTNLPEPASSVPIQKNTLAIVLPKGGAKPDEPCWALVGDRRIGGNYEVQIGRFRRLNISWIIVQPDQIVPVYLTDGTFKNPRHAIRRLTAQLFLHLLLVFYSSEGSKFLRLISEPLSRSDFVLFSRRGKNPPLPTKKPEA